MQQGAGKGAERDCRAYRFCNGGQGKAPAQSDRAPWDASPSSYGTFVIIGGDELRDVSSEHFVLQNPSMKVAVTFNFIFSEKSEVATPHQEK